MSNYVTFAIEYLGNRYRIETEAWF